MALAAELIAICWVDWVLTWIVTVGAAACFVINLRIEEADMALLFPDDSPQYAAHTKRLIPFVY